MAGYHMDDRASGICPLRLYFNPVERQCGAHTHTSEAHRLDPYGNPLT